MALKKSIMSSTGDVAAVLINMTLFNDYCVIVLSGSIIIIRERTLKSDGPRSSDPPVSGDVAEARRAR